MSALTASPQARAGVRAPARDQAWRLRALVEQMAGADAASAPGARRVPVVAIASGKGGVGKTNLAVNMCIALAQRGLRAALLDADLGMANADVLCGLTPGRRLDDLLRESGPTGARATLESCIVEAPGGFLLVPGAVGAARVADLDASARRTLIDQLSALESRSDVLVVDTGAGIGSDVLAFAGASDWLVLVATPEPTSLTDAYGLVKCLVERARRQGRAAPRVAIVVNELVRRTDLKSVSSRLTACCERFLGCRPVLLGGVRLDPRVAHAVRERRPHMLGSPRARASADIRRVAGALAATLTLT